MSPLQTNIYLNIENHPHYQYHYHYNYHDQIINFIVGNTPIHVASQNGHIEIVNFLINRKANLDAKNNKGNTAFHMALSYDYFECCDCLIKAGADIHIVNTGNFVAHMGIDGDKSIVLLALHLVTSIDSLLIVFDDYETRISEINEVNFVSSCLKIKKRLNSDWTNEVQDRLKKIMSMFPKK
jgi:ankyrin repeat protein